MLQENKERRRRCNPGIAYCISNYAVPNANNDLEPELELLEPEEDIWFTTHSYYYQIANTLGLERLYQHMELECFITFSVEVGGCSILKEIWKQIQNGARFTAGDFYSTEKYTVEFRNSENCYGPCLRVVVLEIEEEFQSLPEKEAWEWLFAHGPLIDPYASYYD